jgi:hypothetical protein
MRLTAQVVTITDDDDAGVIAVSVVSLEVTTLDHCKHTLQT